MKYKLLVISFFFLFCLGNTSNAQTIKYYRQLSYNHVSPHVNIKGNYEIGAEVATRSSHYIFKYDKNNRLIEIINHHYEQERKHHLTHFNVYRVEIRYEENEEIRIFYDKLERRMTNMRGVYKEVFTYKNGFKSRLDFFDLKNQPMESNWKIASYQWKASKDWIIEKRYNLNGEEVPLSPYFNFQTTAIEYDQRGFPKAHYNLNADLEITNSNFGVAVYKDIYDEDGNHIKWSYHNAKDELTPSPWEYAVAEKSYNENGKNVSIKYFDTAGEFIREREMEGEILKFARLSAKDSLEIEKKSLGYLKALRDLNPELMKDVMHEKLAKRTQGWDQKTKKEIPRETTYDAMIKFAESWNNTGDRFPTHPKETVEILDAYHFMASVKMVSDNWVEYLHLIKLDGEWKIINLLWQHKDTSIYPH